MAEETHSALPTCVFQSCQSSLATYASTSVFPLGRLSPLFNPCFPLTGIPPEHIHQRLPARALSLHHVHIIIHMVGGVGDFRLLDLVQLMDDVPQLLIISVFNACLSFRFQLAEFHLIRIF